MKKYIITGLLFMSLAGCVAPYEFNREEALVRMAVLDFGISSESIVNYSIACTKYGLTEESWNWQNCIAQRHEVEVRRARIKKQEDDRMMCQGQFGFEAGC
jgi:hypothetical protein